MKVKLERESKHKTAMDIELDEIFAMEDESVIVANSDDSSDETEQVMEEDEELDNRAKTGDTNKSQIDSDDPSE